MALPKKNRLSKKSEIDGVFKKGAAIKGNFLFVKFLRNQKRYSRFTFIVPAKHINRAVDRNRAKRMLSGSIINSPVLNSGYDIIAAIYKKINKSEIKNLVNDFLKILTKIQ